MLFGTKTSYIKAETVTVGSSLITGITGLPNQIGIKLNPTLGQTTAVIGQWGVAASFYASGEFLKLNYLHENFYPITSTFYLGAGAGATVQVDIMRLFYGYSGGL